MTHDSIDPVLTETLREILGVTIDELAQVLNVYPPSIKLWESGDAYPQSGARDRIRALIELVKHLNQTFNSPEARREWLHCESPFLGRLTPLDILLIGRVDRVEAALKAIDSGVFI